ncbi:MAG: hypothetical protein JWL88_455 [Parcubacteria group bacterium]|nr:hypothetical protein [Parcubacteria group bacterium]
MEACCIIKPEGLRHIGAIIRILNRAGMRIREQKMIIYTESLIQQLYDHMSPLAQAYIAFGMADRPGLALLIDTPCISRLLAVAGSNSDPQRCEPHSIRFRYGIREYPKQIDGWEWWENAFHRPIDLREAERDLQLLFPGS